MVANLTFCPPTLKKDVDQTQKTPVSVTPAFTMTTKEVKLWGFELKFIVTLCSRKYRKKQAQPI